MKKFKKNLYIIIIIVGIIIVAVSYLMANALHERLHVEGECCRGPEIRRVLADFTNLTERNENLCL